MVLPGIRRIAIAVSVLSLTFAAALASSVSDSRAIIHEITGATCNNPTGRFPEPPGQFRNFANALIKTGVIQSIVVSGNVTTVTFDTSHPAFKGDPNAPSDSFPDGSGGTIVLVPGFACP